MTLSLRPAVSALLVSALALTACASNPDPVTAPAPPSTTTTTQPAPSPSETPGPPATSAPAEADAPAFPATTGTDTEEPAGGALTVVDARVGRQDGFDRVVLELAGDPTGAPGWSVSYTDSPTQDGSGDPVEVAGDTFLSVRVTGVGLPFETGQEELSNTRLEPTGTRTVEEVVLGSTFEGQYEAYLGLSGDAVPFRVFRLTGPARVVIDLRDP